MKSVFKKMLSLGRVCGDSSITCVNCKTWYCLTPKFRNRSTVQTSGGEGWWRFPVLWSGQKPWWNWLIPVVNFAEVLRAKLAKSSLLPSTLGPLGSFKVCSDAKESGEWKATGSYRTYSSIVKLQPWFLSLQWKTCPWAEHSWWWWWLCLNIMTREKF